MCGAPAGPLFTHRFSARAGPRRHSRRCSTAGAAYLASLRHRSASVLLSKPRVSANRGVAAAASADRRLRTQGGPVVCPTRALAWPATYMQEWAMGLSPRLRSVLSCRQQAPSLPAHADYCAGRRSTPDRDGPHARPRDRAGAVRGRPGTRPELRVPKQCLHPVQLLRSNPPGQHLGNRPEVSAVAGTDDAHPASAAATVHFDCTPVRSGFLPRAQPWG